MATPVIGGLTAPRWVFTLWLWAGVPAAMLHVWGCAAAIPSAACRTAGLMADVIPIPYALLALIVSGDGTFAVVLTAACVAAAHLAALRWLPARLSLPVLALLVVAWVAVGAVVVALVIAGDRGALMVVEAERATPFGSGPISAGDLPGRA